MKILIITEKLNTACKLAAVGRKQLGDFLLPNGKILTNEYISNNEKEINSLVNNIGKLENSNYIITYVAGHIVELYQAYDYDSKYKNWKNIPFGYIPEEFKSILNIGRVQTAVLNEIVRIEELIKKFKSKTFYEIICKFYTEDGIVYNGVCDKKYDNLDEIKNIIESLNNKTAKIKSYKIIKEKESCQNLFDQTNLAIETSNKYKLKPEETLKASQCLYEKGFQTYPRTSSRYITTGDLKDFELMLKNINKVYPFSLDYKTNKKIINNKKVESHSAIVPTSNIPNIDTLNNNEKIIYKEVVLRSIAVNFPPAIDEKQNIETVINNIIFKTTGKKEIDKGWRKVYDLYKNDTYILGIDKKKIIKNYEIDYKEIKTQPPKRYTMAKILKFMESCGKNIDNDEIREIMKNKGIGTSSTRAEIIKKLINYSYITTKGNTIYPTQKGIDLIEILPIDELKDAEFTGNLEYKLYQIEKQEIDENTYFDYIKNLYIDCCKKLDSLDINNLGKCPICNNNIIHKKSDKYNFYGCTNYINGCKFSIGNMYGVLIDKKDVVKLLSEKVTDEINGFKYNETGNEFTAKLQLIDNKINLLKIK